MDEKEMERWVQTGSWGDEHQAAVALLEINVREVDGVLQEQTPWVLHDHMRLTPVNAKRVRRAALCALQAFTDALGDMDFGKE